MLDEWNNRQLGNSIGRWKHGREECKSFKLYYTFKKRKKEMRIFEGNELCVSKVTGTRASMMIHRSRLARELWIGWIWKSRFKGLDPRYNGWIGHGHGQRSVVSMRRNARTHTESNVYFDETDRREETATGYVYERISICGIGYTCHVLTGCPIKRFGTSSRDPSFFRSPDTVATPFISRI